MYGYQKEKTQIMILIMGLYTYSGINDVQEANRFYHLVNLLA